MNTTNQYGWISTEVNEIAKSFLRFAHSAGGTVLDIGAGSGLVSRAAADLGVSVVVNEIAAAHLAQLSTPGGAHQGRIIVDGRRFPNETDFPPASFAAVHASLLFHFLSPDEIELGFRKIARWLRPGGRLYALASSPYVGNFSAFLPTYERQVAAGAAWPGFVEDVARCASRETVAYLPRRVLLVDEDSAFRASLSAGLQPEDTWYFRREHLDARFRGNGNENIGILVSRPMFERVLPIRSYRGFDRPRREIQALRTRVWQCQGWLLRDLRSDEQEQIVDDGAIHWTAFDGSHIVAAARLNVLRTSDDAAWLRRYYPSVHLDAVSWPAAMISRLVVEDSHRGLGLGARLDWLRLERAWICGARSVLVLAKGWRAAHLKKAGFRPIGHISATERRDGLLVDAEVLLRDVPGIN